MEHGCGGKVLDHRCRNRQERRADAVRGYLVDQGLGADSVTARGFGKTMPVADNGTPAGRQRNRRVEIVVSGEVIGMRIGT